MERRTEPRVILDIPVYLDLELVDKFSVKVILVDLSRGGMQFALPAKEKRIENLLGHESKLSNIPSPLKKIGSNLFGYIAWSSPQRCGIRFHKMLAMPHEEIEAIMSKI